VRAPLAVTLLLLAVAAPAAAEESRWNVHLHLGGMSTVKQPDFITTPMGFVNAGLHLRASVEWTLIERVGVEVGYGLNALFHNVSSDSAIQQLIFVGARVRGWWAPRGGYIVPRPTGRDARALTIQEIISDAWADAHIALALSDKTRFAYDIGIGSRVAVVSPLQLGVFVRFQHLPTGGDGGFMQVIAGLTVSLGFLPVHAEPDEDEDGVPDAADKCPGTPKGANVNRYGCEIRQSDTKAPPCSDTDLDGVCDGEDDCPDTKLGTTVDKHGCPLGGDAKPPPEQGD
jgi:hypothetical protein